MTAALACAHKGASAVLMDRQDPGNYLKAAFDGRASAIAASSYRMYEKLGISERLEGDVQPITDILISDGEAGRYTSPLTLHFDSDDAGGGPMGYMVENRKLRAALFEVIKHNDNIEFIAPANLLGFNEEAAQITVRIEGRKDFSASALIAADGRNSFCRKQAGIGASLISYKQKAIVTTVAHEKPHNGVAHELFLPGGPFAILPITDSRSSIVWTDTPGAVDAAMALPEHMFADELARRFGDMYGQVGPCAPRWAYPLSLQMAEDYVKGRVALIGDAAHAIHPIAGQGLNMGLRDAAALADVVHGARANGLDVGMNLDDLQIWRNFDNRVLASSTDIFNRLFSNNIAPIKHARRLGLGLMDKIKPAQSFFIREAAGLHGDLPSLLR
ncbi:MAG: UbiH/UbiF/VisC/COQ6 family ubiquinone biosynthesis hydroxylase [Hellea sp.]|nr:UbiH/UbiF/VisC/COQ6 family ubiquinone biosynthesis hydroxylase [Hellea sp.]